MNDKDVRSGRSGRIATPKPCENTTIELTVIQKAIIQGLIQDKLKELQNLKNSCSKEFLLNIEHEQTLLQKLHNLVNF